MGRAWSRCSNPRCPTAAAVPPGRSRCEACERAADLARGTAAERGYDAKHEREFRKAVLDRDPVCRRCRRRRSRHADHHPRSRRELERLNLDPNDPQYGRGLCGPCHSAETAVHQPGGFRIRP